MEPVSKDTRALTSAGRDDDVRSGWPDQGGANQGAQVFSLACAGCHGADGSGGPKGPAIATIPAIIALPDAALIRIVHDGVPGKGMPAMPQIGEENTQAVVQYLRKLQGVTIIQRPMQR